MSTAAAAPRRAQVTVTLLVMLITGLTTLLPNYILGAAVRARPGRSSGLTVSHNKLDFYGAFV